jgi:hypothetical protein
MRVSVKGLLSAAKLKPWEFIESHGKKRGLNAKAGADFKFAC